MRAPFPPPCWLEPDQYLGAAAQHSPTFPHIFPASSIVFPFVFLQLQCLLATSFQKNEKEIIYAFFISKNHVGNLLVTKVGHSN
jgi:hypothetical protein